MDRISSAVQFRARKMYNNTIDYILLGIIVNQCYYLLGAELKIIYNNLL